MPSDALFSRKHEDFSFPFLVADKGQVWKYPPTFIQKDNSPIPFPYSALEIFQLNNSPKCRMFQAQPAEA